MSAQLYSFLQNNYIYEEFQSGFRPPHSTETALVKITNDLLLVSDQGCISLLVLLDLSAAFDTIDHDILIDRLQNYTGIQGQALRWLRSYLSDRYHFVYLNGETPHTTGEHSRECPAKRIGRVFASPKWPAMGIQCAAWKSISRRLLGTNNWVVICFDWASWVTRYNLSFIREK